MKWSSYTVENNWLFKPIGLNSAVTWMIEENYTCVQTQVCGKTSDKIIYIALTLSFSSCYHAVTLVALSDVLALPPASSVQHSSSGGLMNISPGELVQVYIFSALHPFTPVHDLAQSLNHCCSHWAVWRNWPDPAFSEGRWMPEHFQWPQWNCYWITLM